LPGGAAAKDEAVGIGSPFDRAALWGRERGFGQPSPRMEKQKGGFSQPLTPALSQRERGKKSVLNRTLSRRERDGQ
jgi:hypothetical protein